MGDGLCREPYTCEKLNSIRGGYTALSQGCPALQFDFTDPQVMSFFINHSVMIIILLVSVLIESFE